MTLDEIRRWLALAPAASLDPLAQHAAPVAEPVQQGFAAGEPTPLAALLASFVPRTRDLPPPADSVWLARHALEPAIALFGGAAHAEPRVGELLAFADGWALDGRRGGALASLHTADGELALQLDPDGSIAVYAVDRSALDGWDPAPFAFDPPDPSVLLGEHDAPAWLVARLDAHAALGGLDTVVAVGDLLRLWRPTSPDALLAAVRDRRFPPIDLARAWCASLPADAVDALRGAVLQGIDDVDRLVDAVGDDADAARLLATRRDALDALQSVIEARGDDPALTRDALDTLDARVATRGSSLPPAGVLRGDPWLGSVAIGRPDAWWARWALP